MAKETYTEIVIRLDEKLKDIVDQLTKALAENSEIKKEYPNGIKELTIHVNFEDNLLQARVKVLEDINLYKVYKEKHSIFTRIKDAII